MYEFIKKVKRFEVKWPENCTAEWVTFAASADALAEEMGAEVKAVFPEREIHNPGEVRADWWSRDVAEARW